jgi:tRNA-2-methylthio-N6-dimethylallyladenosine synthase
MNNHDSEKLEGLLLKDGHEAASGFEDANLVLLNTCSIREKAVHKVHTRLGYLREEKKKRPIIIGVLGCWAQQEKTLLQRMPQIDFVLGTMAIQQLPRILKEVLGNDKRIMDTNAYPDSHIFPASDIQRSNSFAKAMVTIIEGCNHACTYCIVPTTRGSERHRPFQDIIQEINELVSQGFREVELLGQNVNSFQGGCSFPELLDRVAEINDLEWIRFSTSHPINFTPSLARTMLTNTKVVPFLHLPVQSGSDEILRRMRRGYTVAQYLERLSYLGDGPKDLCISTDFIVGFPGETDANFEDTITLLDKVKFDLSFSFLYSPRPGTPAMNLKDDLPYAVKLERLNRLKAKQTDFTILSNSKMIGRELKVRIETPTASKNGYWLARTSNWKNVHIRVTDGCELPFRCLISVKIVAAGPHFLVAEII